MPTYRTIAVRQPERTDIHTQVVGVRPGRSRVTLRTWHQVRGTADHRYASDVELVTLFEYEAQ